jgi:metal-responsive CopG/Arc/MetJ family transcriptional regulator
MKVIELTNQLKVVGFRLPQQSLTKLDESASRIGISRADLMRNIVFTYLEFVEEHPGDEAKSFGDVTEK